MRGWDIAERMTGSDLSFTLFTDKTLLLQPFCTKAQFLSGKAKVDLIEKVAGIFTETVCLR